MRAYITKDKIAIPYTNGNSYVEEAAMNHEEYENKIVYKVVVNHEEQYSIWPADRDNPLGWREIGNQGSKQECLDYIERVWVDMRPLSLRKRMAESKGETHN